MALRIRELTLELNEEETLLGDRIAATLGCQAEQIKQWKILKKGIDARKKNNILRVYALEFEVENERKFLARFGSHPNLEVAKKEAPLVIHQVVQPLHVVVAGMGPAGLFCALTLAECGCQVTLLERGKPVEERLVDVRRFWDLGAFDANSNVQFGEGGAGTFSDGKLTTRLNHPGICRILARLVALGAPEEIQYQAKPHIGSDRLRNVLIRFRRHLLELGVEVRFHAP